MNGKAMILFELMLCATLNGIHRVGVIISLFLLNVFVLVLILFSVFIRFSSESDFPRLQRIVDASPRISEKPCEHTLPGQAHECPEGQSFGQHQLEHFQLWIIMDYSDLKPKSN